MAQRTVLVVEDEANLLEVLRYNLASEGYRVLTASDGEQALELARQGRPDAIVLDLMLPKLSGFEVCRTLRRESTVPILMLTARDEEVDRVVGLELGADDYVTKPFSMRELLARVRAQLRRGEMLQAGQGTAPQAPQVVRFDSIEVNLSAHSVAKDGVPLAMKPKEVELLAFFASNPGRAFTREQLLEKVWGYTYAGESRTVDVHIRWLRGKIERDPSNPRHLITVRGVGYRFEA